MLHKGKDVGAQVAVSLLKSPYIGRADFEVEELGGIVTIKGVVSSQESKDYIDALARDQEGVVRLINNLTISSFLDAGY
jgi:osmotically-inducible protein OsmY